tara:strand:+ start:1794 stop:2519 length:726 start_codon:yes stop_codon:yes gene_type:complete
VVSKKTIITTSWDDGHPLDLKLGKLLKENSIKGTFYTPITNWANESLNLDEIEKLSNDFEIGGHTYNHAILTLIPEQRMNLELLDSKTILEKKTNREIISFCYPLGQYNDNIKKHVKDAGYLGARTSKIFKTSYSDSFEFHPTIHTTNRNFLSKGKGVLENIGHSSSLVFKGKIFKHWSEIAKESLKHVLENGGIWHLWGHSWEIEQNGDWEILADILNFVKQNGKNYGAEFLNNGDIFKK